MGKGVFWRDYNEVVGLTNQNQANARKNKNDEYYTIMSDIENELKHYDLTGKIIYCNCDSQDSNFYKFFKMNFGKLGIKHVTATHLNSFGNSYRIDFDGVLETTTQLMSNGDFRAWDCASILKGCDIVITNPPFSLWREHYLLCRKFNKDLITIGIKSLPLCRDVFIPFMNCELSYGYTVPTDFMTKNGLTKELRGLCRWYTTLPIMDKPFLKLTEKYDPIKYPKFDNGDVINVDKITDIPCDYYGVMGVPVTIFDYLNPNQFEVLNTWNRYAFVKNEWWVEKGKYATEINGKRKYSRILIRMVDKCATE